jgi:hypothetical protein
MYLQPTEPPTDVKNTSVLHFNFFSWILMSETVMVSIKDSGSDNDNEEDDE